MKSSSALFALGSKTIWIGQRCATNNRKVSNWRELGRQMERLHKGTREGKTTTGPVKR